MSLQGDWGEMKKSRKSSSWIGKLAVLSWIELKLYLPIWTVTIKSRDANFEKSNTSKCDLKPYLEWQTMFSKSSLLQMNVGESFPVCIDCSLPSHKEMMGMKVAMLASVHSSLQLMDLSWIFTIWIFLIKKIFLILFPLNIALRASFTLSAWNAKKP